MMPPSSRLDFMNETPTTLTFERYGRSSYQLSIKTAEDLSSILDLDERLWMATSCPVNSLNMDPVFLQFLDADNHGRIFSEEVRDAVRWIQTRLHADTSWTMRQDYLLLTLIKSDHDAGAALLDTARRVLENLDQGDSDAISLAQVRSRQIILAQADRNGDGVIPPEVVAESEVVQLVRDIMATCGSVADAGGLPGIDQALLDRFVGEGTSYLVWYDQGRLVGRRRRSDIMAYGKDTPAMWTAIAAVRDQIDRFFTQCALVRFDARAAEAFQWRDEDRQADWYDNRQAMLDRLRRAPIYPPNAEEKLRFDTRVNEVYREALSRFHDTVVKPIIGDVTEIDRAQWQAVLAAFAAYETWLTSRPDTAVDKLDAEHLRSTLAGSCIDALRALIAQDKAVASELERLQNLEKLILYHQHLFHFINNFVSLPWLFNPGEYALFEMGTLVLAGREFATSLRVENRAAHAAVAQHSDIYLLYLTVSGPLPEDHFEIVVPVTRGNPKIFYMGQRGVFFTTRGRELDARIVQIVENPISLRQSMLMPFRRMRDVLSQRFEQLTSSIHKDAEAKVATAGSEVAATVQEGVRTAPVQAEAAITEAPSPTTAPAHPAPPAEQRSTGARDMLVGAGFLLAGVGAAFKFLVDTFSQLGDPETLWTVFLVGSVLVVTVVLFTALHAWLKLRRRDLAGVLQAGGWAMNAHLRLNRKMVRFFVRPAALPPGAGKTRRDRLSHRLDQLRRIQREGRHISRRLEK